jgi:hypothetical protein
MVGLRGETIWGINGIERKERQAEIAEIMGFETVIRNLLEIVFDKISNNALRFKKKTIPFVYPFTY